MNTKNCQQCNQSNPSDMKFCLNCGTEILQADDLPATVFGGFPTNPQAAQTQPNFQPQPNFQQPNFQPQQTNFQQPNFQQPNFQTAPAESGGNMTKIFVGIGGALIGLIFLASGGVQLYKAFNGSSSTSQNFYPNNVNVSNSGNKSNTSSVNTSNAAKNTNSSSSSSQTIADFTQENVGDWTLRDTITGNPEKDGFPGATEEKQFKYYNASGAMLHLTVAQYSTAYDAQKSLRTSMQKFKTLKLNVSEEVAAGDNDGNEIGIMQTMASANGKIFTCYWTNKNFLFRALGTENDVENFVKKSKY